MLVAIHTPDLKEVARGRLSSSHMHLKWRSRLYPRRSYTLRLYSEPEDAQRRWEPGDHRDVQVLERCDDPPPGGIDPRPPERSERLMFRIRFEVDNDLPIPRMVRWQFQSRKGLDVTTWRLPLVVRPTLRRQVMLVGSTIAVLWLASFYDALTTPSKGAAKLGQITFVGAILFAASFALWFVFSRFWTPRE